MVRRFPLKVVVSGAVLVLTACTGGAPGPEGTGDTTSAEAMTAGTPSASGASTAVESAVTLGAEVDAALEALMSEHGEYAAFASYQAIIDEFGALQPYPNIRESEQTHIGFLVTYLEGAGVEVPASPWLGEVEAPDTLVDAAQAGIDAEIANIAMYDDLLARNLGDQDLVDILTRLRAASQDQHLPAFESALAKATG